MNPASDAVFRYFDPDEDVAVTERRLPHWGQAGTLSFITWRTWDSLPHEVMVGWLRERSAWLSRHKIDPTSPDWREKLQQQSPPVRIEFHQLFSSRWHALLDDCHGESVLRRAELSGIVAEALRKFDGDRYRITDFVVMPNHVHLIAAFPTAELMLTQCENWKHFTAVRINKTLGRTGRFWQVDSFDHLIRSEAQFIALREYIARNPIQARLREGEYVHYSSRLADTGRFAPR